MLNHFIYRIIINIVSSLKLQSSISYFIKNQIGVAGGGGIAAWWQKDVTNVALCGVQHKFSPKEYGTKQFYFSVNLQENKKKYTGS